MFNLSNKMVRIQKEIGLTNERWAAEVNKSWETLKKQISKDANPTVLTLMEDCVPLHASVEIVTEEEAALFAQIPAMQELIGMLENRVAAYQAEHDEMQQQINTMLELRKEQEEIAKRQANTIAQMQQRIEESLRTIDRLVNKYVV